MPKGQKSYDWNVLKVEWLSTDLTINQFREQKNIGKAHFYKSIDVEDWYAERENIYKKAATKLINKRADVIVRKYDEYYKLWNAVKAQAAHILKKTQLADGTIEPLTPYELKNLTEALENALKSERLLEGESTENINNGIDVYNYILKVNQNGSSTGSKQFTRETMEIEQSVQDQIKKPGDH